RAAAAAFAQPGSDDRCLAHRLPGTDPDAATGRRRAGPIGADGTGNFGTARTGRKRGGRADAAIAADGTRTCQHRPSAAAGGRTRLGNGTTRLPDADREQRTSAARARDRAFGATAATARSAATACAGGTAARHAAGKPRRIAAGTCRGGTANRRNGA